MATGFVTRWKGKIAAISFWDKGFQVDGVDTPSTDSTMSAVCAHNIRSSSGAGVYTVPRPPLGGGISQILAITQVSSGVKFKAPSGVSFGVTAGNSTTTVLTSTQLMTIELYALSSALYNIIGVFSTSTASPVIPTLSTTT